MGQHTVELVCRGCDEVYVLGREYRATCSNSSASVQHILEKRLDLIGEDLSRISQEQEAQNPFTRYNPFLASYHLARELGINYDALVQRINQGLVTIGEPWFRETPLSEESALAAALGLSNGTLLIKNETGNVTGSHKARHLMGTMLYLEVLRETGAFAGEKPRLAIYSCGNAALGAAAVANAAGYQLGVFVPVNVNPIVERLLLQYGAIINKCERVEGENGDPCYNKFKKALEDGALAFSCSGPDNWSNIEGGETLYYELGMQAERRHSLDALVIQVGGGALASAGVQAFEHMKKSGLVKNMPRVYAVQTEGGFPLVRAYYLVLEKMLAHTGITMDLDTTRDDGLNQRVLDYARQKGNTPVLDEWISLVKDSFLNPFHAIIPVQEILKSATDDNSYMWTWEQEPHSIAHGILDDFTYDWLKIIEGMLMTGGRPIIVTEEELREANRLSKEYTGVKADHTGTSGLAGAKHLIDQGIIKQGENVAVLFTGVERN